MSPKDHQTRRSVLQNAGCSLGVIIGASGLAAAKPDGSDVPDSKTNWISVEDARFVLNVSPPEVDESTFKVYQNGVENFNTAIEAGLLHLDETNKARSQSVKQTTSDGEQQPAVQQEDGSILRVAEDSSPTQIASLEGIESADTRLPRTGKNQASAARGSVGEAGSEAVRAAASSCNRNGIEIERYEGWIPGEVMVRIYLSDDTISDINAAVGLGGVSGPFLYDYAISRGWISAGALTSAAASAVFVAVAAEWAWIQYSNDGCGVIIHTGYSPVNPTYQVPTVEAQG